MSETRAKNTWSPSRRTLVKGAAWTAPAVVVATAAPAYAATRPPVAPPPEALGCKYPGDSTPWIKSYRVELCFTNSTSDEVDVVINSLTWRGVAPTFPPTGSVDDTFFDPRHCDDDGPDAGTIADNCGSFASPYSFHIGANGEFCFWIFWRGDASAQNDMCFNYTYNNGFATVTASACTTIHFDPDCGCTTPQPPYDKGGANADECDV
jgi:hypothetical protein